MSDDKQRLDVVLVERGLAHSRTHAQELIDAGQVYLDDGHQKKTLKKSSYPIFTHLKDKVFVLDGPANRYVSRGGLKLEGALRQLNIDVRNMRCLDVGISTGGFTDCLLQEGAVSVVGLDVGHDQVHESLLNNNKVKVFEGINARQLSSESVVLLNAPPQGYDFVVMDVSFISITLIIPEIFKVLKKGGKLLSLVKPQFEVGVDGIAKGGIVKDRSLYFEVENKIKNLCKSVGFRVEAYIDSPIQGKDGNNEFFICLYKA